MENLKTPDDLLQKLKDSAQRKMTPREIWDQRVSFAFGQMMENPNVTREMVEAQAVKTYGPRPE